MVVVTGDVFASVGLGLAFAILGINGTGLAFASFNRRASDGNDHFVSIVWFFFYFIDVFFFWLAEDDHAFGALTG